MVDVYRVWDYDELRMPVAYSGISGFQQKEPGRTKLQVYGTDEMPWTVESYLYIDTKVTMNHTRGSLALRNVDTGANTFLPAGRIDPMPYPWDNRDFYCEGNMTKEAVLVANGDPDGRTWQYDHYNRLVSFFRPPPGLYDKFTSWEDVTPDNYGSFLMDSSGYIRSHVCNHAGSPHIGNYNGSKYMDEAGNATVSSHPYHYFGAPLPGKWNQMIVDCHQTHNKDASSNVAWSKCEYPYSATDAQFPGYGENDTSYNYFDAMWKWYVYMNGNNKIWGSMTSGLGEECRVGAQMFYREEQTNDNDAVEYIYSVMGSYDDSLGGANGEFHIAFNVKKLRTYAVEIKWSYSDIHAVGWDGAGVNTFSTDTNSGIFVGWEGYDKPGDMPYHPDYTEASTTAGSTAVCRHFWTAEIDPTQAIDGCVYFAIRPKQGEVDENIVPWHANLFRQICIPVVDGDLPTHLQEAP